MKVSVIIPVYNAEKYLRDTINSVLSQTVKPFEIIFVNDGSDDRSVEIINDFNFNFRIYENNINRGIGYTRQKGLELARGDYVAFLSSDDAWHKKFLEESCKKLTPDKGTYTDFYQCNERLEPFEIFRSENYSIDKVIDSSLDKNMFINLSTTVFPNNKCLKFIPELRYGEDLIFLLDAIIEKINWVRIPKPLVYYRIHRGQGTYKKKTEHDRLLMKYAVPRLIKFGLDKELIDKKYRELIKSSHYRSKHVYQLVTLMKKTLMRLM